VIPAIANAIFNAVGVRVTSLPISEEEILRKLKEMKEAPEAIDAE
jgi:CO/xanthine dehydrogenase Mo-binding subunit